MIRFALFLSIAVIAVGACEEGLNTKTDVGYIQYFDAPLKIEVPAVVVVGELFDVRIRTYGTGCLRKGRTNVNRAEDRVVIVPLDTYIFDQDYGCTEQLEFNDYSVALKFDKPGTIQVIVQGRVYSLDGAEPIIEVHRPVQIQGGEHTSGE